MSEVESIPYVKIHRHNIFQKIYWACRRGFERIVCKFQKSPLEKWAENEVRVACEWEREASGTPKGQWDYGCACYKSALKALKSLAKDQHSGMSIRFTQRILNRLINWQPLTPIEDRPEDWSTVIDERDGIIVYQHARYSALFKHVYHDGTIKYNDVDRSICEDIKSGSRYHSGMVHTILNEMYPITMPYMPHTKPYVIYCEELLTDRKNGDYDTTCVDHLITPDGENIEIMRFFKESEDHSNPWTEISYVEWNERVDLDRERQKSENPLTDLEQNCIDLIEESLRLAEDYKEYFNKGIQDGSDSTVDKSADRE